MILSKRQLSLFRGNGGGLSPLQAALAQFGFWAPLETSVALYRGYGAASFTRATTATVKDWEGAVRNCVSGEVRFAGQRRVRNTLASIDPTKGTWTKTNCTVAAGATDPDGGVTAFTITATANNSECYAGGGLSAALVVSVWIKRRTGSGAVSLWDGNSWVAVSVTSSWQRFAVTNEPNTAAYVDIQLSISGDEVDVWHPQCEVTTGASNQNPSEYVSVGAAKLNEFLYTEELDNAAWTKSSVTVAANAVASPSGAATAESLLETAVTAYHYIYQAFTVVAGAYTFSVFVKPNGRTRVTLRESAASGNGATFELTGAGSVVTNLVGGVGTITAEADGWYRCSMTGTEAAGGRQFWVLTNSAAGSGLESHLGDITKGVYLWGMQLERAAAASTYFPVGSVYPYHGACVDGVKYFDTENGNTVASNVVTEATGPAITRSSINEYGYLAESARTNLVLQSSNFGTTWTAGGTPTRSAAAAYCGEIALDLIGDDTAAAAEYYAQTITFTGDATKSISFLVEQGTSTSTAVRLYDSTAAAERLIAVITWSGGAPVVTYTTGSAERASEYMGGGAWRIFCLTASVTAANTNGLRFYPASDSAFGNSGTGDIYIGGVQAENATTASVSHIPTTTATVTRNADFLTYPVAGNVSGVIGTCYVEVYLCKSTGSTQLFIASSSGGYLVYKDLDAGNALGLYDETTGRWAAVGDDFEGALAKCATQWNTTSVLVAKGGTVSASLSFDGNVGLTSTVGVGENLAIIRNVRIATVALTDAELQLITQ